jgi:hypothetical protein
MAGPSDKVAAALDKAVGAKAAANPEFGRWVQSAGKYSAANLAGKWDWSAGKWDPDRNAYLFVDTGARINFKEDAERADSLDFDIKSGQTTSSGSVAVNSRTVPTLTFFTTATGGQQGQPAQRVPAGFYVAMYVVDGGQSRLIMWDPARDAVFQARKMATERFRGLGDAGTPDILPELPPAQGPTVPPATPPAVPPAVPPAIPPAVPPAVAPGTPPAIPPDTPIAPPPVTLPPPAPVPSIMGTWKVLGIHPSASIFIVFKAQTYETYAVVQGYTTMIDTGVYALEGNTLTYRSNVSGQVTTSTLSMEGNILTSSGPGGIVRLQRVR